MTTVAAGQAFVGGERLRHDRIHFVVAIGAQATGESDPWRRVREGLVAGIQSGVGGVGDRVVGVSFGGGILVGDAGGGMFLAGDMGSAIHHKHAVSAIDGEAFGQHRARETRADDQEIVGVARHVSAFMSEFTNRPSRAMAVGLVHCVKPRMCPRRLSRRKLA